MKRYDERILNGLIDRYERSQLYTGTGKRKQSIGYPVNSRNVPEYFDDRSSEYQTIHEQLEALEERGLIRLHWKDRRPGHILQKVSLVPDQIAGCYELLGRKPREVKEAGILRICLHYREAAPEESGIFQAFLDWVVQRLEQAESIRQYADLEQPEAFDRLCRLLLAILTNTEDCYLREFSVRAFHDSKVAERELDRAAGILRRFGPARYQGLGTDEVLEDFGIYRNPGWVYLKGCGRFEAGLSRVDLSSLPEGIGVTAKDLDRIDWDPEDAPDTVVTIENLTAFYQWRSAQRTLAVYLGGFANRKKTQFLTRLYQTWPDARYFHYGDIDCGGFRIWKALREASGVPSEPYRMDLATYRRFLHTGRELTANDRKQLQEMRLDPFYREQQALFEEMLRQGRKLEQESLQIAWEED